MSKQNTEIDFWFVGQLLSISIKFESDRKDKDDKPKEVSGSMIQPIDHRTFRSFRTCYLQDHSLVS